MSFKHYIKAAVGLCLTLMVVACNGDSIDKGFLRDQNNPVVRMETSKGSIYIELYQKEAPLSVENFLEYTQEGYYDNTIFHRVIDGFMIQGGGFEAGMKQKKVKNPISNEAENGLVNDRGTIAMARTNEVHSATSQFFINVGNNVSLNHKGDDPRTFGYAVFGKVIKGMDIVDLIRVVPTTRKGYFADVPKEDVVIKTVKVLKK